MLTSMVHQINTGAKFRQLFCVLVRSGFSPKHYCHNATPSAGALLREYKLAPVNEHHAHYKEMDTHVRESSSWDLQLTDLTQIQEKKTFINLLGRWDEREAAYLIASWTGRADPDVQRQKEDPTAWGDYQQEMGPVWHNSKSALNSSTSFTSASLFKKSVWKLHVHFTSAGW